MVSFVVRLFSRRSASLKKTKKRQTNEKHLHGDTWAFLPIWKKNTTKPSPATPPFCPYASWRHTEKFGTRVFFTCVLPKTFASMADLSLWLTYLQPSPSQRWLCRHVQLLSRLPSSCPQPKSKVLAFFSLKDWLRLFCQGGQPHAQPLSSLPFPLNFKSSCLLGQELLHTIKKAKGNVTQPEGENPKTKKPVKESTLSLDPSYLYVQHTWIFKFVFIQEVKLKLVNYKYKCQGITWDIQRLYVF